VLTPNLFCCLFLHYFDTASYTTERASGLKTWSNCPLKVLFLEDQANITWSNYRDEGHLVVVVVVAVTVIVVKTNVYWALAAFNKGWITQTYNSVQRMHNTIGWY